MATDAANASDTETQNHTGWLKSTHYKNYEKLTRSRYRIAKPEIPTLPITDGDENSTYSCKFGLRQEVIPSKVKSDQLYGAKYFGDLRYRDWEDKRQNLSNADELAIYEGQDTQTRITVNDAFPDGPDPVEPSVDLSEAASDSAVEQSPGQLFTNYPAGGLGGTEDRHPFQ